MATAARSRDVAIQMKIGVDVSGWINRRAFGRYTRELVRALVSVDRRNDYWLFLDAETARSSEDLPPLERARRVLVETSRPAARAASASGYRSLRDVWRMGRAVRQHGRGLDLFYFPSLHTVFPLSTQAKVVVTLHDTTAERHPELIFPTRRGRLLWTLKTRWALWRADLIFTVSEAAKADIIRTFGVIEHRVKVVPDAVDAGFRPLGDRAQTARVLARYGLHGEDRVVLYVGGIAPHKNLETLIDAYASLIRGPGPGSAKLVIVGDIQENVFHSNYPAVRDRVARLGLGGHVVFTGFVPDPELVHFYNASEVLVLPSFAEGFGLPALEAMACGIPVVASRAGALPEVVGDAGLFFSPHAPLELRDRLQELLEDQGLREELARRGLRRAREFSWERSAQAALAAFDALVRDHGPRRA